VLQIIEDREMFEAKLYKVSKDLLRRWKNQTGQCEAITAKGKRCRNYIGQIIDPKEYVMKAYCTLHYNAHIMA